MRSTARLIGSGADTCVVDTLVVDLADDADVDEMNDRGDDDDAGAACSCAAAGV